MSSSNLLKTFGKGADVALQLANDKALRRKTTEVKTVAPEPPESPVKEIVEDVAVIDGDTIVPHTLGFVPKGAWVIKQSDGVGDPSPHVAVCTATTLGDVTMNGNAPQTVTIWIE